MWMDDVALIHNNRDERMLDSTEEVAQKYHLKFGKEKSQVLRINPKNSDNKARLGDMELDNTDKYKYLGMHMTKKGTLYEHLKITKGKVEASIQTIFHIAGNENFTNIQMTTIWKLITTCTIPIITYGAEVWIPTKQELKQAQSILCNVIKRILKTPVTTPNEVVQAETGIWDI